MKKVESMYMTIALLISHAKNLN